MTQLQGVEHFDADIESLYGKLSDAGFMVGCLESVQEVKTSTPDRAEWVSKLEFAFLPVSQLNVTLDITGREPGVRVRSQVRSEAAGAGGLVTAEMTFAAADAGGTDVQWAGELTEVEGLLKMVPPPLLRQVAGQVIESVWKQLRPKLEAE